MHQTMLTALACFAVSACGAAGGTAGDRPDSDVGSAATTSDPTAATPDAAADEHEPSPAPSHSTVMVASSAATRTLMTFVRAHADSVNSGRLTPELAHSADDAELDRQQEAVDFAAERGYAVPTRPVVAVVSSSTQAPDAGPVELGVCVWLPSTEYIDAQTGEPPSGPVPEQWAPAVATLTRPSVTWVVASLASPDRTSAFDCREAS